MVMFGTSTQGAIVKLDEIARLAGVSRTTASYVINGKAKQYRVSDEKRSKVMAVVREHNYHPNAVAAGLRAGRTRLYRSGDPGSGKHQLYPDCKLSRNVRRVSAAISC